MHDVRCLRYICTCRKLRAHDGNERIRKDAESGERNPEIQTQGSGERESATQESHRRPGQETQTH